MLVLSRRVGERLLIGDDIVLTILDSRGDGVRIGIEAPRSMKVHRAEVIEAVTAANKEALAAPSVSQDQVLEMLRPTLSPAAPSDAPGGQDAAATGATAPADAEGDAPEPGQDAPRS